MNIDMRMVATLKPTGRLLPICSAILLLSGCGGGGNSSSSGPTSPSNPAPTPAPLSTFATLPDGLTATLTEDRAAVAVGGSVTYTLTLANNTAQPVVYQSDVGCGITNIAGEVESNINIVDATGHILYSTVMSGETGCSGFQVPAPVTVAAGQSITGTVTSGNVFSSAGRDAATATLSVESTPNGPFQTTTVGPLTVTVQ